MRIGAWILPLVGIFFAGSAAHARRYDSYRADYMKGAFCSAIGGACASDDDPEGSFFQNPASLTLDPHGLVFDGDYNQSDRSPPGTNASHLVNEESYMGGIAWSGEKVGIGLAAQALKSQVSSSAILYDDNDQPQSIKITNSATRYNFYLPVSYHVSEMLSVGIALQTVYSTNDIGINGTGAAKGTNLGGGLESWGISAGVLYRPAKKFRFGAWGRIPKTNYNRIEIETTSFGNTIRYKEDYAFHYPWMAAFGVSILPFEDDTTLLFDINVIGATPNGYFPSFDSFSSSINGSNLLAKGRRISVEPRFGFRGPIAGTPIAYMLGTYLEAGRTESTKSRWHGTGGFSVKILSWLEPMVGFDVANDFKQIFISFR